MSEEDRWNTAPLGELTKYIVDNHHVYLRQRLPFLCEQLTNEVRRYWVVHPEFLRAHSLLYQMRAMTEQHLIKEETMGFPLIAAHDGDAAKSLKPFVDAIDDHIKVHGEIEGTLKQIRETLWDYTTPNDLGSDVSFTLRQLGELEADLAKHVHLENDILFPRAKKAEDAKKG